MIPKKAPNRMGGYRYLIVNDCYFPRLAELQIPVDDLETAHTIRDYLSEEDVLGTIYGELLIYNVGDDWTLIDPDQ